jgi:hypothetical protein
VKILNRALMVMALLAVAGAAQARPSVSVGGGGCEATLTSLVSTSNDAPSPAPAPAGLLRLSQLINRRVELQGTTGGVFCVAVMNDVGTLTGLIFDTNIELGSLDLLPDSRLTRLRVNPANNRVTVSGGAIRHPVISIRVLGTSRERVFITPRRIRSRPGAVSEP